MNLIEQLKKDMGGMCDPIRAIRFSFAAILVLILIFQAFGVGIASAESGQLSIIKTTNVQNTALGSSSGVNLNFSRFIYDATTFSYMSQFNYTMSVAINGNETAFWPFTFSGDVTASSFRGVARWVKADKRLIYDFPDDMKFTESTGFINLTFDDSNFENEWTAALAPKLCSATPVALNANTNPVTWTRINSLASCTPTTPATNLWNVTMLQKTYAEYDVQYNTQPVPPGNFFLFVNKKFQGTTTTTKINLTNGLQNYSGFPETAFNNDNISYIGVYNNGLFINMTDSAGSYSSAWINTTGAPAEIIPATIIDPNNNTLNGVGLVWGSNTYALGAIGNISWIKTTPIGSCDVIRVYNPSGSETDFTENPADTGFYKTLLDATGTWKAEYRRKSLCVGSETVLNTAYTDVNPENPSYIIINQSVPIGQLVNVTYKIGWIPSGNVFIKTFKADDQTVAENVYSVSTTQNTEITTQILFTASGLHYVRLCDPVLGCKAQTLTTAFFNGSEVTTNITQSNITMDKAAYSYGDHAQILTAVDNFNWSNKQISVVSYNWDYGISQHQQYVLEQVFSFDQYISDTTFAAPGTYSMRLVGTNSTGSYILSFWNFTLSDVDTEGYGLSLSNSTICVNQLVNIKVTVPSLSFLNISFDDATYNRDYIVNQSKIIPFRFTKLGTYYIVLHDTSMEAKRTLIVTTQACAVVTPTPTPLTPEKAQTDIANLLMNQFFWALILTVGFMIATAIEIRRRDASPIMPMAVVGFLSISGFTLIGWIPGWITFGVILISAVIFAWQRSKDMNTAGE